MIAYPSVHALLEMLVSVSPAKIEKTELIKHRQAHPDNAAGDWITVYSQPDSNGPGWFAHAPKLQILYLLKTVSAGEF